MAYNALIGKSIMSLSKQIPNGGSVLEIGSQTLDFVVGPDEAIKTVPDFYHHIGFERYDAIDFNNEGTILADLNRIVELDHRYDLVTNNGTSEHVFNQAAVFETMHINCKVGGYLVHSLPWINYLNHGFFSYQPTLFLDLAAANKYEVRHMFAADRWGERVWNAQHDDFEGLPEEARDLLLVTIMRRVNDSPFAFPVQGIYADDQRV